ncbi:MAG: putative periplasmic serine endoprotease DegP-like precursor [Alphaproteobacteria bacterium ADurb.Bin438]|nr:MAG: putative periplasmic serine endoprotease DegP-like precursor [Alphaproteobacteria bacterium ADurb.Bin438]
MEENFFENAFNDNEKTISRSDEIIEFGLHLKDLDKDLRQKYSIKEDKKGVFVTDVDKDSLSYEKGIKSGDLILELGQKKVSSVKSFIKQLQEIKKSDKQSVLLLIENENGTGFIALKLN